MNYIRNVRILWTLLQFLEFAQPYHKEYAIPVSSIIQLECDDGLKVINDINVTVRRSNTTCLTTSDECTLPNNAIESIKDKCNKHSSCKVDIHDEITNHWCLQDYGYFNFWYACKTITDLSCDFESDECKWSPVLILNRFRWEYGLPDHNKFPDVDHTSASSTGKYAYIYAADSHRGDIAKLESDTIIATQQQCLSFWYFKTNSRDKVHLLKNDLHLLNLSNYIGKEWHRLQVPLGKTSHNSYKLVFKVERGKNSDGSFGAIVIDDILIANQNCQSSLRECDFDTNECDINNEHSSKYVWRKKNGYNYPNNPETDHTTASIENIVHAMKLIYFSYTLESGYYLYLSIEVNKAEETTAYLEFQNIEIDILVNSCFTFWYYMYGYNGIGGLTVSLDDEHLWRKLENKDDKWMKGMIDVSKRNLNNIKVIGIIGIGWVGDIAIDDLYITEGTCKGLFDHEKKCVHLNDGVPKETFCPRGYLEIKNPLLSFDPEKEECSEAYDKTNMRILQECQYRNDSEKCLIDMSTDIRSHPECFQVYELQILHTCEEKEITTVLSNYTSKRDSSAGEETTTILSDATPEEDLSTVKDGSGNLPRAIGNSSKTATGLLVGLVVGALLLSCVVILTVVLIRRHTFKSKPRDKIRNKIGENDYIGSQDIALSCLPLADNHSKHMQNTGIYNEGSDTSLHGHDSTNANAHINNVQHGYTNVDAFNGFVNKEKVQVPTHAHHMETTFADNHILNDDEYAIVDPTAETSFNETINNRTGTVDSYMILDPNDTGFNRTTFSNTPVDYEFAKPVKNTEKTNGDEDQYALSEEGVYDHMGSNRHKELEDNIYNHAVDTVYDSGSHKRNAEVREDTYDHFIGQQTEDDYDISTTT